MAASPGQCKSLGPVWSALMVLSLIASPVHANFYEDEANITVLTVGSFSQAISDSGTSYFVEFYADWCHACNALRPVWKSIAAALANTQHPCKVGAVSCEDHASVCREESIPAYPELRYYPRNTTAQPISYRGFMHAQGIFEWVESIIGPVKGMREHLEGMRGEDDSIVTSPAITSSVEKITVQDMSSSILYSMKREVFKSNDVLKPSRHKALLEWVGLLETYFPFAHNRASISHLRSLLEDTPNLSPSIWDEEMRIFQIGSLLTDPVWPFCGSAHEWVEPSQMSKKKEVKRRKTRESQTYPCGMWLLFHSLGVRTREGEDGKTISAIRCWVKHFFGCKDCVHHFSKLTRPNPNLPTPAQTKNISTFNSGRKSILHSLFSPHKNMSEMYNKAEGWVYDYRNTRLPAWLWVWAVHNRVNVRLYGGGGRRKGEGADVHVFPTTGMCPTCRLEKGRAPLLTGGETPESLGDFRIFDVNWNKTALGEFLATRYCMSGPPDEKEAETSKLCRLASIRWTPAFRRRHIPGKEASYLVGAFVASLLAVVVASCFCAAMNNTSEFLMDSDKRLLSRPDSKHHGFRDGYVSLPRPRAASRA
ncbi:hypothetical protein AAMO2058_000065800 [Amorphochlora amoebiformis]